MHYQDYPGSSNPFKGQSIDYYFRGQARRVRGHPAPVVQRDGPRGVALRRCEHQQHEHQDVVLHRRAPRATRATRSGRTRTGRAAVAGEPCRRRSLGRPTRPPCTEIDAVIRSSTKKADSYADGRRDDRHQDHQREHAARHRDRQRVPYYDYFDGKVAHPTVPGTRHSRTAAPCRSCWSWITARVSSSVGSAALYTISKSSAGTISIDGIRDNAYSTRCSRATMRSTGPVFYARRQRVQLRLVCSVAAPGRRRRPPGATRTEPLLAE